MLRLEGYPEKILKINDLAYILPDDFEGDIVDALKDLIKHLECGKSDVNLDDGKSAIESLLDQSDCECPPKICMRYGVFKRTEDGYESTS